MTLPDLTAVNGLSLGQLGFLAPEPSLPEGMILPPEVESIAILGGKAYLDVSVYTSDTLTNQNWSVATNGVIEVTAEGKSGFFYLMSKPSVPSK